MTDNSNEKYDANRDPVIGAPGEGSIGKEVVSALGTAMGAVAVALAGPALVAGGIAGGVVEGLVGRSEEKIDPTVETMYWMNAYTTRPYVKVNEDYSVYEPAYRYGWESYDRNRGRKFEELEGELARAWEEVRGKSTLLWEDAKAATRDAWERLEQLPVNADHDRR